MQYNSYHSNYFQTLQQQITALKTVELEHERAQASAVQQVILAGKIVEQTKVRYKPVAIFLEATRSLEQVIGSFSSEPQRDHLLSTLHHCSIDVESFMLPWATAIANAEAGLKHALFEAQNKEELLQQTKRLSAETQSALQRNSIRLSPDLLGRVFEWFVLDDGDNMHPSRFAEYSRRPLVLSSVCHTWRAVAHARRSLWQNHYLDIGRFNSSIYRIRNHILLSNPLRPSLTIYGTSKLSFNLQAIWSAYQNTAKLQAVYCYVVLESANTMSNILSLLPPISQLRITSDRGLRRHTAGIPTVQIPVRFLQFMADMKFEGIDPRWETVVWPQTLVQSSPVRHLTFVSATKEPPIWLAYLLPQVQYLCYDLPNVISQHPTFFKKPLKLLKLKRLATTWKSLIHWCPNNFEAPHLSSIVITNSWGIQCPRQNIEACLNAGLINSVKEVSIRSTAADVEGVCHFLSRLTRLNYLELWGDAVDEILSRLADRPQPGRILGLLQQLSICNYEGSGDSIVGFLNRRGALRSNVRNVYLASIPLQNVYLADSPKVKDATWSQICRLLTQFRLIRSHTHMRKT
ncbi:hypothetical protein FRC18_009694 [Serendipita sp. 400]|nr:hypothetical protein FRC18_009694 [Serendipita sp. 400]